VPKTVHTSGIVTFLLPWIIEHPRFKAYRQPGVIASK